MNGANASLSSEGGRNRRGGEQETLQRIMNGLIAKNLELERVMGEFEKRVFYYRSQKFIEKITAPIVASISRGPNGKFVLGVEGLDGSRFSEVFRAIRLVLARIYFSCSA